MAIENGFPILSYKLLKHCWLNKMKNKTIKNSSEKDPKIRLIMLQLQTLKDTAEVVCGLFTTVLILG